MESLNSVEDVQIKLIDIVSRTGIGKKSIKPNQNLEENGVLTGKQIVDLELLLAGELGIKCVPEEWIKSFSLSEVAQKIFDIIKETKADTEGIIGEEKN